MGLQDIAEVAPRVGPTEQDRQRFASTFLGTLLGQAVVLVSLLVGYMAAIAVLVVVEEHYLAGIRTSLGDEAFWALMGAPFVLIGLFWGLPTGLRALRERRLHPLSKAEGHDPDSVFRLRPYGPADRDSYHRPDKAVDEALAWIAAPGRSLLYLSGPSGAGKSSLVGAGLIPRLRDNGWDVLEVRAIGDAAEVVRAALLDAPALFAEPPRRNTALKTLLARLDARRGEQGAAPLLIVVDQFEEFLILNEEKEREGFAALLAELAAAPLPHVKLLLVFRSDYRELLFKLGLPDYRPHDNAFELAPFSRAEAEAFLRGGRRVLDDRGYAALFRGLDRIEDTRGLCRPITLNMVGLVLERMGGAVEGDPGRLIQAYLRDCLVKGDARDFAPPLLAAMITDAGTKAPRREADLAALPGLKPWQVQATLAGLRGDGLVRPFDDTNRTWEISHDFIARLLGPMLGRLRRPWLSRVGAPVLAAGLAGWAAALFLALPLWSKHDAERALATLRGLDVVTIEATDGIGLRVDRTETFDNASLADAADAARRLPGVTALLLTDADRVTDLSPLVGMSLTSLDLSFSDGITDLAPLRGMPLNELALREVADVTDLSPLQGMPLTTLHLTGATGITDLSPLAGLPLQALYLSDASVTDLSPLKGMPLTLLTLSSTQGVTDLSPLKGMPLKTLDLSGATGITDLSPLAGMPLTTLDLGSMGAITDLSPLKGMPLTTLDLSGADGITDLSPLAGMPLELLDLSDADGITDLSPLRGMQLKVLVVSFADAITDLSPLDGMNVTVFDGRGSRKVPFN